MKVISFLIILIQISVTCVSQNLSGRISDAENNDPLIGANVIIKGTTIGTSTDEDGKFALDVSGQKTPLTVSISYLGFISKEITVNDLAKTLNVKLDADKTTLEEVQVTASRLSDKAKQSPLTVESMDQIAIKQTPAFNFYEGLGQLKGVDITSASLGFKIINTRGFNSTSPVRSLQIIDGVDNQAPGLNFSLGNFLGCSDLDVLSVDLIVGASSAFYGPNAFNGVISMKTKDPFQTPGLSVSLKYGERNLFEGAIRWAQVIKNKAGKEKFAYKLNGFVLRANDWEANNMDSVYQTQDGKSNPGGYDAVNRYGDEFYFANDYTQLVAFYPGLNRFYRTGYIESDLVDYNTRNYKANASFEYKLDDSTRIIYASNFGSGTTVYQGDNRYSLKNILFFQNRLELKKEGKYFIRAFATNESAGDSYDAYFTALLLQRKAKSDINWGSTDYANYWATQIVPQIQNLEGYPQFTGDYLQYIADIKAFLLTIQPDLFAYHQSAAGYANNESLSPGENAFFQPGSYEFDTAFNSIVSKESYSQGGSKLYDKSALYNLHGEYKFTPKIMDITVGANYRIYKPNSNGTIFSDTNGVVITNWEYGIYGGLEKWFFKDQLKLNATCRMDKNVNFDYLFSPAASAVYLYKKQVFRLSFSSAIRNPTLTDQYLFYNVGRARLVGNINGFDSLVTVPSLLNFFNYANPDTFSYFNIEPVRPEQVKTVEFGYRASLFKHLFVDMSYYYSWYKYFIGYKLGADIDYNSIVNRVNDFIVYRVAANAIDEVTTQGFSIGVNYYIKQNYTINGNYTYNKLDRHNSTDPLIPAFNTPLNKYNIGFNGRDLQFPQISLYNVGFSINYRWVEGFIYEGSPQFTGYVPTYGKLDVQVNKQFPKISMNLKIGASNILNDLKYEVYGGPYVGRLAYVNAVFDFGKK